MQRRTRLCVTVGPEYLDTNLLASLVEVGADAFMMQMRKGDEPWIPDLIKAIRDAEILAARPLAVVLDLPERAQGMERIVELLAGHRLRGADFLAVSSDRGSGELDRLREHFREVAPHLQLIAKFDQACDFADIEGLVRSAHGVLITEDGLRSLPPSEAPIAQKTISRQCQVAAKPCLVARNALREMPNGRRGELADYFDLANLAFDHVDCVVLTNPPSVPNRLVDVLVEAERILISAENYLEITDRPVRVGFGQPPNTAALAYAIRHLLKMQEIAAVAVYSITGLTSRVIAKNWIDCPVLAFSARPETARTMCLYHGVISRHVAEPLDAASLLNTAGSLAKEMQIAAPGDRIIVVSGHPDQSQDQANGFIVETIT